MAYNELKQRGTYDFPIELYEIDGNHPKYEMAHHWHSEIEIIRIISGSLHLRLNNREIEAEAGDVIFVNSETVHGGVPDSCVYECIVFNMDMIFAGDKQCSRFLDDLNNHLLVVLDHFHRDKSDFTDAADKLFSAMKGKACSFEILSALYGLFSVIISSGYYRPVSGLSEGNIKGNIKLKRVLTFIRASYDSQISLEQMAETAGMSPKYFCYFFKEMTGKSPIEYLNTYRIERAARKLLNSDRSVTEIAYTCGFNDLSYFIKTFKTIKGITPKAFRKKAE